MHVVTCFYFFGGGGGITLQGCTGSGGFIISWTTKVMTQASAHSQLSAHVLHFKVPVSIQVIPYQFTEGSHMTLSDLDEIRFVGSPSGHM